MLTQKVLAMLDKIRSSHQRCSVKQGVLKNFANFTEKYLCWSLSLRPATLLKKRLQHRCFPMKFAKILRTPVLKNICERLPLQNFYLTKPKLVTQILR